MLDRGFFLGFIKIHILHHASEGPIYGLEMVEELGRHGYRLGPGTLYPTLHRMEKEGYLDRNSKTVDGKVRKYYTITGKGLQALEESRNKIKELVDEVLE